MADPVIASKTPFAADVKAGETYHWCACGRSKSQPFCDGSHRGTGFSPVAWTAEKSAKVFFCGCKHTASPPLCDGTHKQLS